MTNPYISLLRTAWRYAQKERLRYAWIYFLFICANIISALNPVLLGWFINQIQKHPSEALHYAGLYAAAFLALKLGEWSFHGPARVMERQLAFNLSRNFLMERYHQALHLPAKWHEDHHSGATINRIRKAYEALKGFFDGGFLYLHAISKFVLSFAAMLYFSPLFGGIGVLMGLLTIRVIFIFDKPFIKTQEDINEKEHNLAATLFDSLSNIMTVITLRLEKNMENGLLSKVRDLLSPFRRNAIINEWKWFTADLLVTLTYCVITIGYIFQHARTGEVFYVGALVTLLGYVNQFTSVFHDVAWQYNQIVQNNTDVQTALNIEKAYLAWHRADRDEHLPASWHKIIISGLNFSHMEAYDHEHAPQSLHDVSVTLMRGKRIAIIGESGSGKSTLLALLRGLYEPEPGLKIKVDGLDCSLPELNQTVTLFPQEPEIFENTVLYNISLGLPFESAQIEEACRAAHFTEVAGQLPHGLDSNIQEKGVNLSGGQKQRLALARGILAATQSEVVLLDEPTSSVDPKTEMKIYEDLFRICSNKAMMSALHRLHLLPLFDYIYVLDKGNIVAEGSFPELHSRSSIFRELWKHQEMIQG